jgi:hypothetical protein
MKLLLFLFGMLLATFTAFSFCDNSDYSALESEKTNLCREDSVSLAIKTSSVPEDTLAMY